MLRQASRSLLRTGVAAIRVAQAAPVRAALAPIPARSISAARPALSATTNSAASDVVFPLTVLDFESKVTKSTVPVIIQFSATWCGPCRMLSPILERVVKGAGGKVKLAKVDIDEDTELAHHFQVSSVPFVVAFKDGKPVGSFVGVRDEASLKSLIADLTK